MDWLLNILVRAGRGLWNLLTKGLQVALGWIADGFMHFIAGGAVSGATKVLDSARGQASNMGVRGSTTAIGYSGSSSSSSSSSSSRPSSAAASSFMGQFI